MLARLGLGIALASMTALVLVGCAPPEPTEEEVVDSVTRTLNGFFETVDEQYAAGSASASELAQHATDELARTWASDIQAMIDSGGISRGVPTLSTVEVTDDSSDRVAARFCADQSEIVTTLGDGTTPEPQSAVAWEADLVRAPDDGLLLDRLEPIADTSVCA